MAKAAAVSWGGTHQKRSSIKSRARRHCGAICGWCWFVSFKETRKAPLELLEVEPGVVFDKNYATNHHFFWKVFFRVRTWPLQLDAFFVSFLGDVDFPTSTSPRPGISYSHSETKGMRRTAGGNFAFSRLTRENLWRLLVNWNSWWQELISKYRLTKTENKSPSIVTHIPSCPVSKPQTWSINPDSFSMESEYRRWMGVSSWCLLKQRGASRQIELLVGGKNIVMIDDDDDDDDDDDEYCLAAQWCMHISSAWDVCCVLADLPIW